MASGEGGLVRGLSRHTRSRKEKCHTNVIWQSQYKLIVCGKGTLLFLLLVPAKPELLTASYFADQCEKKMETTVLPEIHNINVANRDDSGEHSVYTVID